MPLTEAERNTIKQLSFGQRVRCTHTIHRIGHPEGKETPKGKIKELAALLAEFDKPSRVNFIWTSYICSRPFEAFYVGYRIKWNGTLTTATKEFKRKEPVTVALVTKSPRHKIIQVPMNTTTLVEKPA